MPWAKVEATTEIYYETLGEGPAVLLIMGTGADHTAWAFQAPALVQAGYRVILPDNRGVGRSRSDLPSERYTVKRLAEDLRAVLDEAQVERAHVIGMSLGSAIAQELTLAHPDRVGTLHLNVTWGRTDPWLRWVFQSLHAMAGLEDRDLYDEAVSVWACSPWMINDDAARLEWISQWRQHPYRPSRQGLQGQWTADLGHDAMGRLRGIQRPTLVTAGEIDSLVPARYGRQVAEAIPGARFHLFTGARSSHIHCIEMAGEFNGLALEFMAAHRIG